MNAVDRMNPVMVEFHANGFIKIAGKDVKDASPSGKLSRPGNFPGILIAVGNQLASEPIRVDRLGSEILKRLEHGRKMWKVIEVAEV